MTPFKNQDEKFISIIRSRLWNHRQCPNEKSSNKIQKKRNPYQTVTH
jgi:hypothetical protein